MSNQTVRRCNGDLQLDNLRAVLLAWLSTYIQAGQHIKASIVPVYILKQVSKYSRMSIRQVPDPYTQSKHLAIYENHLDDPQKQRLISPCPVHDPRRDLTISSQATFEQASSHTSYRVRVKDTWHVHFKDQIVGKQSQAVNRPFR